MKISLAQINPTVGDIKSNYELIVKHAKIAEKSNAEILITPEVSPQEGIHKYLIQE